jgi:hypothetical protein
MLATGTIINAQQKDFPKLTGSYLDQKTHGKIQEIFTWWIQKLLRNLKPKKYF